MTNTPQPESEVAAGWGDTLVAIVGCQIQRRVSPPAGIGKIAKISPPVRVRFNRPSGPMPISRAAASISFETN